MRAGYLGPEGTFTHEALLAASGDRELELVALPTIYDTVMAVHDHIVDLALVPIENSLEGSVNVTLDALATDARDVVIVGEVVHPITQCLIGRRALELSEIEVVVSHPHANAQCARFIRTRIPQARVLTATSTADAIRRVGDHVGAWAALGNRLAAERYGCVVLQAGVEDVSGNETRFVWLGPVGSGLDDEEGAGEPDPLRRWKTSIVFWGAGSRAPGWLVRCLGELASRGVNLTRIESRPLRQGLGQYMFFVDLEGRDTAAPVAAALGGLQTHVEALRVLGSFPVA